MTKPEFAAHAAGSKRAELHRREAHVAMFKSHGLDLAMNRRRTGKIFSSAACRRCPRPSCRCTTPNH